MVFCMPCLVMSGDDFFPQVTAIRLLPLLLLMSSCVSCYGCSGSSCVGALSQ